MLPVTVEWFQCPLVARNHQKNPWRDCDNDSALIRETIGWGERTGTWRASTYHRQWGAQEVERGAAAFFTLRGTVTPYRPRW